MTEGDGTIIYESNYLITTSLLYKPGRICGKHYVWGLRSKVGKTTKKVLVTNRMAHGGRCKTLDASADGYVRSEACVAILFRQALTHPLSYCLWTFTDVTPRVHSLDK